MREQNRTEQKEKRREEKRREERKIERHHLSDPLGSPLTCGSFIMHDMSTIELPSSRDMRIDMTSMEGIVPLMRSVTTSFPKSNTSITKTIGRGRVANK